MRRLLLLMLLPINVLASNSHYLGYAYDVKNGNELYREEHWVVQSGESETRLVLYRCPSGEAFARKWVRGRVDDPAPNFDLYDQRDGYREGVIAHEGGRDVYVQEHSDSPLLRKPLPDTKNAVIDAGFDAWIRAHWTTADAMVIPFLVPSRFAYVPLKVQADDFSDKNERQFRLRLNAWYGFAAPDLIISYNRENHQLRRYQGLSNLRSETGGTLAVRIEFPPASTDPTPSTERQQKLAAATPLVSRCGNKN